MNVYEYLSNYFREFKYRGLTEEQQLELDSLLWDLRNRVTVLSAGESARLRAGERTTE